MDFKNKEQIKKREISGTEHGVEFRKEAGTFPERPELSEEEKLVSKKLRKEIELMELDDKLKAEAEKKSKTISFLGEDKKVERLLEIAREKGVVFSVQVAKKMNDPYLLDVFHDVLAQEGYYKKFIK